MQKIKVGGQSAQKTEWKQSDGQTDKQTYGGDGFTSLANAIGNKERPW